MSQKAFDLLVALAPRAIVVFISKGETSRPPGG